MAYEVVHSEIKYQGRAFTVVQDKVLLPDHQTAFLDIVKHNGAVTIMPVDIDGNVLFVRQYRHPTRQILLELPAGTLEPGESPYDCAAREIREEIGMSAKHITKIGEFFMVPGYSTEYMYAYLATELISDPLQGDDDEFIEVEKIPLKQVYPMVRDGKIIDAKTLTLLFLAQPFLDQLTSV
jgi:ADP-ribose pyrophosphatase